MERTITEARLPFSIKIVRSDEQLRKAVALRHAAYARHVPTFAELLKTPEPQDRDAGCVVLLAESKLDGAPLGTMRIQTNRLRPLALEQSATLPGWLQGQRLVEATRLGVSLGRAGTLVKVMLFKAFYQFCEAADIDWMVIGARSPLDRQYESLLFRDVFPDDPWVPLRHAANLPHRILAFEVESARERWEAARHPMLGLFCGTHHPDIDVLDAAEPFRGVTRPAKPAVPAFVPPLLAPGAAFAWGV